MQYSEFIDRVRRRGRLESSDEAERAIDAAMETLGERLYRAERENLAAQLPHELREQLQKRIQTEPFVLEEFYNRIKARADIGYPKAVELSKVIMAVLREAVSPGEVEDVLAQLPDEFSELFGERPEGPLSPSRH